MSYAIIQNSNLYVELNLLMFSYIDPLFVFEAETNIKIIFKKFI